MNNVVRQIKHIREIKKLHRQSFELHDRIVKMLNVGKYDIRAINVALIMTAALTVQQLDSPKDKLALQEKFLKTYIKSTSAPFTYYKLGS